MGSWARMHNYGVQVQIKNKINSCNTDYITYACENSKLTIPTVDITEIKSLTLNSEIIRDELHSKFTSFLLNKFLLPAGEEELAHSHLDLLDSKFQNVTNN